MVFNSRQISLNFRFTDRRPGNIHPGLICHSRQRCDVVDCESPLNNRWDEAFEIAGRDDHLQMDLLITVAFPRMLPAAWQKYSISYFCGSHLITCPYQYRT